MCCVFIFRCFPFNCETTHIARHLNYSMSIASDTLTPGRSCLCLLFSPSHSCGRATKGEPRQLGEHSPGSPSPVSLASHRDGEREAWASQPILSRTSLLSSSHFRANSSSLCLPTFAFCDREDGVEARGRTQGLPNIWLF